MSLRWVRNAGENGGVYNSSNGAFGVPAEGKEWPEDTYDRNMQSLVEWLNCLLPSLNLPLDASEEELRECLIDGTVLCSILNKLHPGLLEMRGDSVPGPEKVGKFLAAMDEMGLPRFVLADIQQGYMEPVLQCLGTLKAHFEMHREEMQRNSSDGQYQHGFRKSVISEPSVALEHDAVNKFSEVFPLRHGCYADLSDANILELMKSNGLENASSRTLLSLVYTVLDESIERRNGHVHHHMARILKKVVQVIEGRISTQAENVKDQNNVFKIRAEKYQSKIRVLETLAAGTIEEIEVLLSQLQQIKIEKTKIEEKEKLEEQNFHRLREQKNHSDIENSTLREELEMAKRKHEEHCLLLKAQAQETKVELDKKLKELECFLMDSRKKVKELESFSESKTQGWKKKESAYQIFIDCQSKALQELRSASESIKREVLRTKKTYSQELNCLGINLKGLADAAQNYHCVLAENRRLYNEVQELKGNIRVYCRVRPFLPGQCKKQTTIEYIGGNGELVVSNPAKKGKDSQRLFKFNKVFGPAATQEEVFLDTQPLIRSVLDGYNVCIFAYGQTGSGKTYTMSGPNLSSEEDWGVNYRALHDLFQISQSRKSSITYEVGVQMVEIYNEQVRDLLSCSGSQKRLGIWNTTMPNGLAVPDASMHSVASTADVLELMHIGLMNRAVGATALNERSSRSHSVLTVHVHGMDLETGTVLRGNLHLVDLAGSERVDRSEATGDRLREAQHINKSLSALGDVIFSLAQKNSHVPYRNSKLTQVLQSSLGGQAKTLMFVQLNPDIESYSETISTLKFAERVSGVELGAARSNKEGRDIRDLMEQVASLKDIIAKKDDEIERLQLSKSNVNGVKSLTSFKSEYSSSRRQSIGTPRQSPSLSGRKNSGSSDKLASDIDNLSEHSEKRSEAGSLQSMDDFRHHKQCLPQSMSMDDLMLEKEFNIQSKPAGTDVGQTSREDIDLLGFGDADSDERLSDISDSVLSMGNETDGSLGSAVEFTLFPEPVKSSETTNSTEAAKPAGKAENIKNRPSFVSKLPKPPQRMSDTKLSRMSLTKSSTPRASSSTYSTSTSAPRRTTAGISSAMKPTRRMH